MINFFLFLFFIGVLTALCIGLINIVEQAKSRRFALLEDEVDFDDWKLGTPERIIPHNAKPTDFRSDLL